jgi:pyruvate, orthophosphate dikinase
VTYAYALDHRFDLPADQVLALVGGKAANLGVMMGPELRLPVPPGFVVTTQACREFLAGDWPDGLDGELRERMAQVESAVGRGFGDASSPLLVSVRSGAPVSMPGMMDTILNLGLTDDTERGLAAATGNAAFAASCHDRFRSMFREIVGVDDVPEDPWAQLRAAVEAVFRSWNSDRAIAYRRREGIPDDLGTAVTVQAMVFGNLGADSATGVIFTRNPATGEDELYGDVLFDAQGEDVVAGTHATESIAALDERLPALAAELREIATRLERHYADLCDIEFTIERRRLWMLQVRVGKRSPAAALRMAVDMALDDAFPLSRAAAVERVAPLLAHPPVVASARSVNALPLVTGLPASPGLASGPIATDPAAAVVSAEAGEPAILVRAETSPEDVHGMARAAAILTSRGGLASHAAVVARGWGIPAVVGAADLVVDNGRIAVGGRILGAGEVITVDGSTGEVFAGRIEARTEIVPAARTLLDWARELGIAVDEATARETTGTPEAGGRFDADDCLRTIGIKGFATLPALADALLASPDDVRTVVDQLALDGFVTTAAGAYRLTDAGSTRVSGHVETERAAWGEEAAGSALDAFVLLDRRMKEVVTAWQLRDPDAQVINDHTDAAYDAGVLDRLADLHADVRAWLDEQRGGPASLSRYRARLDRAVEKARAGEQMYVASPRVDSYHGVWFELHEDLIRLAGRTREAEAQAGRA